ncbi:uncharacterized protein LOC131072142 isoform X2 [Cryptomeria japonica]|uniref:uncharacterized protein LOC131072142 isoform X2 n=1 Tax=Cryptomeria japonica TaxID=3369 RepID=UPI0027DA4E29|nr:uncharacterized protein LOC131072142 isoform X2 [Cryptomeria japonica]
MQYKKMLPQGVSQQDIPQKGSNFEGTGAKKKYTRKKKDESLGAISSTSHSHHRDSKLACTNDSVILKKEFCDVAQEQQLELVGKSCEVALGNKKQGITHNQMEEQNIAGNCNIDRTTCDFSDEKYIVFRRKRKKSSSKEIESHSSRKEQKQDIASDMACDKIESEDVSLEQNMPQSLDCKCLQQSDQELIKEVQSGFHPQAFTTDHEQKGKMGLECNSVKIAAKTQDDADIDVAFSSQTSLFQEKTPLDNHNSFCEICKVGGELLCCDGKDCLFTYHLFCLDPPLDQVPSGNWFCPACVDKRTHSDLLCASPVVESIWDMKESGIIIDTPCDFISTRVASIQKQRKEEEYLRRKNITEAEHDFSMPTARNNGVPEATEIQKKILAEASSCALQTVDSDGLRKISEKEFEKEKLYYVKYRGLSHVHNRWITESQIMKEAPKQLSAFKRKIQQGTALQWNAQWTEPHRLLRKRVLLPSKHSINGHTDLLKCKVEWLVKWKGLEYDQCTWELEDLDVLCSTSASKLMKAYEKRSKEAQQRASSKREIKAKNMQDTVCAKLKEIPEWVKGANKPSHHMKYINKLHKFWQSHKNAVIIDEVNQDRILTTIMFLLLLIKEFEVARPILVVLPSTTISSWEDEFLRFDSCVNFVVYNGNRNSREVIRKQEFYEESGCVMAQIVLTTCDIAIADLEHLKHLEWEALIVDEFQRINLPKSLCHLEQILVDFRLVLFSEALKENSSEMSYLLSFLKMEKKGQIMDTLRQGEDQEVKGGVTKVKKSLEKYIIYEHRSDNLSGVKLMEHWVPIELTNFQMEQYCNTLIRSSDLLCLLSRKNDSVERLRDLLLSLKKCCNHPYLVDPSLEISLTKKFPERECYDVGINASGKLQLLDNVLSKIKLKGQRLLILFQTPGRSGCASIGDILDDHLRNRLGAGSYERVDGGLAPAKKQAALQRFNCKNSGRLVFLLEKRACGPNIKLSSIDVVIIFDSDWIPLNDLRALQRTHIDTKVEHLKVFRFYSPYTVEERSLIAAKLDIEFDTNLENFNATICQQMLRWGVTNLFENYDKFHGSGGPLLGSQCLYSYANLQMLVDEMSGNTLGSPSLDDTLWVSLVPKVSRTHGYGKGINLFGESEDQLEAERKIPSNVFWTDILNTRQVDPEYSSRRQQRLKRKVQYSEQSKPEIEMADAELKTKRRRVGDTLDPLTISSWIKDAKEAISFKKGRDERAIDRSVEGQLSHGSTECENSNVKDKNIFTMLQHEEHPSLSPGTFDVCKELSGSDVEIVSKTSCSQTIFFAHDNSLCASKQSLKIEESPSHHRVLDRPSTSSIEGSVHQNNESGDDSVLVSPHQNIHLRTKQEILQLCNALKFPDEVVKMAEEFHSHVMHSFHYPIEKIAFAQAVEISLCLAAANCLNLAVDIESSLESAKSQFHFECSRQEVDSVYEKLCQKFPTLKKSRIPSTVAQPCNRNVFPSINSMNQKNTEETCLKDGKASNDDCLTQLIQSRAAHPVVSLYNSTGLDGHQIERVEGNCTLDTTSQHDYLGQPSIRNPVREERIFHPERQRLISITRKCVDVPNQNGIADSDPEPQHIMESEHQNDLAVKNTSLMADRMCAGKQKSINACVLKQLSGQTEFSEGSGRNKEKHKTMDSSRIDFISNTEKSVKLIEKERNSAQIYDKLNQHFSSESEHLRVRQTSISEEENRRYNSIVKDTTAKTTLSQSSSRVNLELPTADKISSQPCSRVKFELTTADMVPQLSSGVNLELATDISHALSGELPQNRMDGPCQISSELHIGHSSQGGEASFLKEWQPKHSSASQQRLPITSIEFREQSQQSPDFSSFTNNLHSTQDPQCNYTNISETQNQSHHTSGVGQVAMPMTPSEPIQSTIMEVGSTVAVATEPSTVSLTSNFSSSAPFPYHSSQIGASASSRLLQPNLPDPLLHEIGRLKKENERIKTLHEEESSQIKAQFQQEFEDLKNKYDTLLEEKQFSFEQKKKNLDEILVKVSLNQRLGEMIRGNTRRENNSLVSGSATQQEQSHQHATHGSGERISQLPNSAIHTDVSANVPYSFTVARSVQASRRLASEGLTDRMLEGQVGSNANSSCFGSTVSTSIPVFQTPADSIVHVPASPTSIAGITTNNGNQVPTSNFSLLSPQNVTGFQPGFKLNLDVNSIVENGDMHLGITEKNSSHSRTCIPESSSGDIMRRKSIRALKNIKGQIEQPQPETLSTSQTNYISNTSEIAGVIYLSDDD